MSINTPIHVICFDWGGTLMSETFGVADLPMVQWPQVAAIEGVEECLKALYGHYTLCIATNASVSNAQMVKQALARVGLDSYFDHYFCAADLGYTKSQSQFWQKVTQALDVLPSQILMVGDSLTQDVLAPKSFGIQTVWFNPQQTVLNEEVLSIDYWPAFLKLLSL